MTAAGVDYVSRGRFTLGIGASGPQVIEGWHGVPYDAPVGRTREIIEICRRVWRRERREYSGRHYTIPLPPDHGTGLGKPLKLINHPVRDRIPIVVAALGPKNVELAAELARAGSRSVLPEKAASVWGAALAAGRAKRDPSLGPLDVVPATAGWPSRGRHRAAGTGPGRAGPVHRGDGRQGAQLLQRPGVKYGYEAEAAAIQEAYLDGRKDEAAALVPASLLEGTSLVGPRSHVASGWRRSARPRDHAQRGPAGHHARERVRLIEQIRDIAADRRHRPPAADS